MIIDFLLPAIHGIEVNNDLFQQDAAICYTSHAKIDLLYQTFYGRLISRRDYVDRPA